MKPRFLLGAVCTICIAVDKHGKTVGSLLRADRGMDAAQEFFRMAVATNRSRLPRKVNLDGNAASHETNAR
jgi:transposase-like protein